ncbi:collagen-binding domain-containing protein [Nocardioides sambongensis]|uniref:collagen-binding domain-containing protein n=1 Tax=Nocardioides sambongensis TaxID=2589074 RepID=UPI00112D608A|nr:collagen-binding domain-containing protein [Nocardioides sambongensis]
MPTLTIAAGTGLAAAGLVLAVYGSGVGQGASEQRIVTGINPVTQPVRLGGDLHPANVGFLVFSEGDVVLGANETEGSIATGGNLVIRATNYQVAAGSPPPPTFKGDGDTGYTYLFARGGVTWENPGSLVRVENQGFTKIGDTSTYDAFNRDSNNATQPYRIVKKGAPYENQPLIEGRSRAQTPESIGAPVDRSVLDFGVAFAAYRQTSNGLGQCENTVTLRNANGDDLARPVTGGQSYITLESGRTNVLNLAAAELAGLAEITFRTKPTSSTPLVVNVSGASFVGRIPNMAGVGGSDAPYILWNFPDATTVRITSGATLEGTLFAPNAAVAWEADQNIEGNVIAASFTHVGGGGSEVHGFPFDTEVSCAPPVDTSPIDEPSPTDPATTDEPTPDTTSPTDEPTPDTTSPTDEPTPDTTSPTDQPTPDTTSPTDQPTPDTTSPTDQPTPDTTSPTDQPTPDTTSPTDQPTPDTTSPTDQPTPDTTSPTGETSPTGTTTATAPAPTVATSSTAAGGTAASVGPGAEPTGVAAGAPSSGLPNTGGTHVRTLLAGVALLLAGAGALGWEWWSRRRGATKPPADS